ncbi:MAG: PQQ-dependent sugar dehydrogenase [Bacteroidota bacterium]
MRRPAILALFVGFAACGPDSASELPPARTIATVTSAYADDFSQGREVYQEYCASCHGDDLTGNSGGPLLGPWDHVAPDADERARLIDITAAGLVEEGMPSYEAGLSTKEIEAVNDYILAVRAGATTAEAEPASQHVISPDLRVLDTVETLDYDVRVEEFADDLDEPWGFAFLDAQTALVTEKGGDLHVIRDGVVQRNPIVGVPDVVARGQGGLLDVTPDPNYAENGWIYLAYSHPHPEQRRASMTRVVRGQLVGSDWNAMRWTEQDVVFEAPHSTYRDTQYHFGTRVVFDPQGFLYFAIGDRGVQDDAQRLNRPNGKIYRLRPDGTVPPDNPFADSGAAVPGIYTLGNRNPQGLTVDPLTGDVWAVEHGPRGGDELNRIEAGVNYGWPTITYGINYNGTVITERRRAEGMQQPVYYWRPSPAVAGTEFYTGRLFARWTNQLLVTSLAYQDVRLLTLERDDALGPRVLHEEIILEDFGRVREAVNGPDGAIYVVTNSPDRILRLSPVGGWNPN